MIDPHKHGLNLVLKFPYYSGKDKEATRDTPCACQGKLCFTLDTVSYYNLERGSRKPRYDDQICRY